MWFFGKDLLSLPSETTLQDEAEWLSPDEAQERFSRDEQAAQEQLTRAIVSGLVVLIGGGVLAIATGWLALLGGGFLASSLVLWRQWRWWHGEGLEAQNATDRAFHTWLVRQYAPEQEAYRLSLDSHYSGRLQRSAQRFLKKRQAHSA